MGMTDNFDAEFERDRVTYEQNCAFARNLNDQMNRMPTIAVTVTGGLWFGAGIAEGLQDSIRFALLLFAGIVNLALILAIFRVRDVYQSHLEKMKEFHPPGFVPSQPKKPRLGRFGGYSMVTVYAILMSIACILSFAGAFGFYWPLNSISPWAGFLIAAIFLIIIMTAITGCFGRQSQTD
jgi:hypothetical protein